MIQEEKELLLKDLCARLPYEVFLKIGEYSDYTLQGIVPSNINKSLLVRCNSSDFDCSIEVVRPYFRPMSSMTEEERTEYFLLKHRDNDRDDNIILIDEASTLIDWLNAHHFDYRGLIEKGLALVAPEGMYNINEK